MKAVIAEKKNNILQWRRYFQVIADDVFQDPPGATAESHKSLRESSGSCYPSLFAPSGAIPGSTAAKWLSKYQQERNESGIMEKGGVNTVLRTLQGVTR